MKGTFNCDVKCGNNTTKAEFVVVNSNGVPLHGKQTAMELGVLTIGVDMAAVREERQKIQALQRSWKTQMHQITLHLREEVTAVAPVRCTPFNLREKVQKKIDELMEADIIEPVKGPTEWLNPVVVAPQRQMVTSAYVWT